jgi:hypothetical protein
MVMIRTANQPIVFSGQIVAYDHDSTYNEGKIFDNDPREITTPNPNPLDTFYANNATGAIPTGYAVVNGKVEYIPEGTITNPQVYRLRKS